MATSNLVPVSRFFIIPAGSSLLSENKVFVFSVTKKTRDSSADFDQLRTYVFSELLSKSDIHV